MIVRMRTRVLSVGCKRVLTRTLMVYAIEGNFAEMAMCGVWTVHAAPREKREMRMIQI
jgi:hypothetical protein